MGLPNFCMPSRAFTSSAAPSGCEPFTISEPPPESRHCFAYSACEPECDSSASIRRIVPPATSASRHSFLKAGACTQFSA